MRYFVAFLVSIGLIIVLILLLFTGGDNKSTKVPHTAKTLNSYATTDAQVQLTIDGPVTADQIHNAARIKVDRNGSDLSLIQGYEGHVIKSKSYAGNENGFATFLHSLTLAGFTEGDKSAELKDERGYCPLGSRYVFELIDGDKIVERFWSTSCNKTKTYLGNVNLTLTLFQDQIPDYEDLTQDANLN